MIRALFTLKNMGLFFVFWVFVFVVVYFFISPFGVQASYVAASAHRTVIVVVALS